MPQSLEFKPQTKHLAVMALGAWLCAGAQATDWTASTCVSNCSGSDGSAPKVSYSAYSAPINTSGGAYASTGAFSASTLAFYSNEGFGVVSPSGTAAPHDGIGNYGYQELVLLKFDAPVQLTRVNLGWPQYDSDITLLAYNGVTTGVNVAGTILGKTAASLTSAGGWSLVGSYADLLVSGRAVNAGGVASSWWIVAAYNSQLGGAPTGSDGSASGLTRGLGTGLVGYDFVKLAAVSGEVPAVSAVPEPATVALWALGLVGVAGMARRRGSALR